MTRISAPGPALRALSFDLFDTLIDLELGDLPSFQLGGSTRRGTQGLLYAALPPQSRSGVSLEQFVQLDAQVRTELGAGGREPTTEQRFAALLQRLQISDDGLSDALTALHMAEIERRVAVPPHHRGVLQELRRHVPLAVCSNFSHAPTARRILRSAGLLELFDVVVISAECGVRKPHTAIFRSLCDQLGVRPSSVLHVGDRLDADVAGARAAGLRTAWLTRRVDDPERERHAGHGSEPDCELADLRELPARLAGGDAAGRASGRPPSSGAKFSG